MTLKALARTSVDSTDDQHRGLRLLEDSAARERPSAVAAGSPRHELASRDRRKGAIMFRASTVFVAMVLGATPQVPSHAAQGNEPASHAPDLTFPRSASELSFFSQLTMGIWKPPGDGPFPAVILVHSCAGLTKQGLAFWRKEAIKRGYVTFVVDSFSSRGSPNCQPMPPASSARGVKDLLQAVEHLKSFPFIDKSRIGMIGTSWGAMVGLLAASPAFVERSLPGGSVGAIVGLYPPCRSHSTGFEFVRPDLTAPTLVLMGGRDNETPGDECVSGLQTLKERNAPVEWHVFPTATHCWDCSDQHGQRWSPPWAGGRDVHYQYDGKITSESAERAFDFLSRHLKSGAQK